MEHTCTWDLVPYHLKSLPITYKWYYTRSKITLMALLSATKHLAAHGFQHYETFAPVTHMATICILLLVSSVHQWSITPLDIKNFL